MAVENFFQEALHNPSDYVTYHVGRELAGMFPARAVIEVEDYSFDPEGYARAGLCALVREPGLHNQVLASLAGPRRVVREQAANAWLNLLWRRHLIDVVLLHCSEGGCWSRHCWIVADTREVCEEFYRTVSAWSQEVRGEILVFEGGGWQKNEELYAAIKSATFDNLVLPDALAREIRSDLACFFESREVYESYGVPWKRGVLLTGPPGNGKTHTIKALVNQSGRPCLYVKSFESHYGTEHENIRAVFARARASAPCLLVLEDLDSLVDDENRSFFLNELDGFETNTGLVVIATTNHPEKLDPAILDRPSRFDRKYHFGLPERAERARYVAGWCERLREEMRPSEGGRATLVELTDGFSFAYLKELFLSSMMQWIGSGREAGSMDEIAAGRAAVLRCQMSAADKPKPVEASGEPAVAEGRADGSGEKAAAAAN